MSRETTGKDRLAVYNALNRLLNKTSYPFDLKYKLSGNLVPTYKEISIYYDPFTKPQPRQKPPKKKKFKPQRHDATPSVKNDVANVSDATDVVDKPTVPDVEGGYVFFY